MQISIIGMNWLNRRRKRKRRRKRRRRRRKRSRRTRRRGRRRSRWIRNRLDTSCHRWRG